MTHLKFIEKGNYSHYKCSNPDCEKGFNQFWNMPEIELIEYLKSDSIQIKKNQS